MDRQAHPLPVAQRVMDHQSLPSVTVEALQAVQPQKPTSVTSQLNADSAGTWFTASLFGPWAKCII